jgi:hypothetical protein
VVGWCSDVPTRTSSKPLERPTHQHRHHPPHLLQVGDAGTQSLADAIKASPSLQRVNLNYNRITGDGLLALAEALLTSPGEREAPGVAEPQHHHLLYHT